MNLAAELQIIASLLEKQRRPYLADVARMAATVLEHPGCVDCGRPLPVAGRSPRCAVCRGVHRRRYQHAKYVARKARVV